GHTGLGIATLVRLVRADLEATEAANLDALAAPERLLEALEDGVHEQLRLTFVELLVLTQPLDQVRLRHGPRPCPRLPHARPQWVTSLKSLRRKGGVINPREARAKRLALRLRQCRQRC